MLDLTPEMKLLNKQVEMLRKEFAELYEQRNYMLQYEESLLTTLYLSTIGQVQFGLFCLGIDLSKLKQRIQLAQVYFNRNEIPKWDKIEKQITVAFEEYQQKIEQEAARLAAAKEYLKTNFLNDDDALQLKNVYKHLVKKLHPDLHPLQTEDDAELFLKVVAAYELCDLAALNAILLYFTDRKEDVPHISSGLKEYVVKLTEMNTVQKQKIDKLNQSFPFIHRENLQNEKWVKTETRKINVQIEVIEKEIKEKTEYLLLLKSWKPELLN